MLKLKSEREKGFDFEKKKNEVCGKISERKKQIKINI